ncbi:MAG TPA: type II toxin-antitoxin system VapC family toxin [Candidatus Sulfotelmatobacter sp.]|jgi:PIN domain nuclease of toxin-antitoxin system|nr:type II toxin-antitoxin system VapC family toxin [Candidatus Sulfotelmatobacter sp.]
MKYLLDTGVWLWSLDAVERISKRGLTVLSDSHQEIYFSAASVWELCIKARLQKLRLPGPPADCVPAFLAKQGLRALPVNHIHALKVYDLPFHHRDPFDRLLIAQAVVEELTILTADRAFAKYPVDVVWCGT